MTTFESGTLEASPDSLKARLDILEKLNRELIEQVRLLMSQIANYDYLSRLETIKKEVFAGIQRPDLASLEARILEVLRQQEKPLTMGALIDLLGAGINEYDVMAALDILEEQKRVKRDFRKQTYEGSE
jgi:hypothetical protein